MSDIETIGMIEFDEQRWWHAVTKNIGSSGPIARALSPLAHRLDILAIKQSKGQHSLTNLLAGVPLVTVTTIGAKSGEPRTMPLVAIPDGENVILIASNWGDAKNPAWYYNMRANPKVILTYKGKRATYLAREVFDEERMRCWEKAVAIYAGYASYERRTGDRQIPVMLLTPQEQMSSID